MGGGGGGQDGCERGIEVFVKIQKKNFFFGGGLEGGGVGWGSGWGGQGGCERRIKVFVKIKKKIFFWGGGGVRWGSGWWGGWVRVDVNAMLGVGGNVGYGGCEPRI